MNSVRLTTIQYYDLIAEPGFTDAKLEKVSVKITRKKKYKKLFNDDDFYKDK